MSAERDRRCVLAFDMDDTLFAEEDYARSGFAAVGQWLEKERGVQGFAAIAQKAFDAGLRGTIFNHTLAELALEGDETLIPTLVDVYRRHRPDIALEPQLRDMLKELSRKAFLCLITDGPLVSQRAKIVALGLETLFDHLRCTDDWGREFWKPQPRAYEEIAECFPMPTPTSYAYIGDNPSKDFVIPRKMGWHSIRLIRTWGLHANSKAPSAAHEPERTIHQLSALPATLRGLGMDI